MTKIPLIIDCDPGVDDAIALFLAFASADVLELIAITTVAGNVPADLTARNARLIRQLAGREEVPVHVGAQVPLVRPPVVASHFHGQTGLGTLPVFEPVASAADGSSAQAIVEAVMSRPPGTVRIAVLGPMTNLALAMRLEPHIIPRLGTVVAMGGARSEGGNITASAEYNIYADPHAAEVVAASGCDLVMLGLDATHQVRASSERIATIGALGTVAGDASAELLRFLDDVQHSLVDSGYPPLHDPCVIAWLLNPDLFVTVPVQLGIETSSPLTLGHTAVEFRLADPSASRVRWATKADAEGVFALLLERLGR